MKRAILAKGKNWWLMEDGATGFDAKTHGPFSTINLAETYAANHGLTVDLSDFTI